MKKVIFRQKEILRFFNTYKKKKKYNGNIFVLFYRKINFNIIELLLNGKSYVLLQVVGKNLNISL